MILLLQLSALFSAIMVVLVRSPILAVLYLISLFLHAAAYLVLSSAVYVGLVYVVVYVGAIAVLFVFVLILLDLQELEYKITSTSLRPLVVVVLTCFIYGRPSLIEPSVEMVYRESNIAVLAQLQALIVYFYSYGALLILGLGFILLLAIVAPILLCKRRA